MRPSKGSEVESERDIPMFLVELRFGDSTERLAARPAHRAKLQVLHDQGRLPMAGPLADDRGAVLVFDVPDLTTLDRLLAEDPYFRMPGVEVIRLEEWLVVVGN
jgi:uncharacterized protein YciI